MTGNETQLDEKITSRKIFIGIRCKITVLKNEHQLFYTGTILNSDETGIIFRDKYNLLQSYNHNAIISIEQIKENQWFATEEKKEEETTK